MRISKEIVLILAMIKIKHVGVYACAFERAVHHINQRCAGFAKRTPLQWNALGWPRPLFNLKQRDSSLLEVRSIASLRWYLQRMELSQEIVRTCTTPASVAGLMMLMNASGWPLPVASSSER